MKSYRIGIDVGGTFTDLVAIESGGRTTFTKSPSTPDDQSIGVLAGLGDLARRLDLDVLTLLGATERIVHGTTVATNALLERKGAQVGLLTTEGHRDVLEMREGLKPERYNLLLPPVPPLVDRARRRGVPERVAFDGRVLRPLDEAALEHEIAALKRAGVNSVAICFLHAYANPGHERRAAETVRALMPDAFVSVSSEVLPQIKEFERVSTTVVNAYVGPAVTRYLHNLRDRLSAAGFAGPLFVTLSHGGIAPLEEAARLAAATVLSGPAGGIAGAKRVAERMATHDLIPFDMGGTSTDISLVAGGRIALRADGGLAGERIALRSLDIISIGAGGGSVASVDPVGTLLVGPESAGSRPGPACFGQGGTRPTVTDANLLLGFLDPEHFLGGRARLDRPAAERAMDGLAAQLGIDRMAAAAGVFRLVNAKMADGIRLMTVRRGVDPRGFALLGFGGAAGLHAAEVARALSIRRVLVPAEASVLSAWGMLASDLRYEVSRSHLADTGTLDEAALAALFDALEAAARDRMAGWFDGQVRVERSAEMRYGEQIYEVDVSLDGLDLAAPGAVAAMVARFHRSHEELYTYASPDQDVVLVNARVAIVGTVPVTPTDDEPPLCDAPAVAARRRSAFLGAWQSVPVYTFDALRRGQTLAGPALIEAETTTVLLHAGDVATVDRSGWLDIALRPAAHREG